MKWIASFILLLNMSFVCSSCGGCSNSFDDEEDDTSVADGTDAGGITDNREDDGDDGDDGDDATDPPLNNSQQEFQMTGIIETCQHCMGYGIVQDGLNGTPQYCKFCGGNRVVDAAINQLPDDFFSKMEGGSSGEEDNNSSYRAQIEAEIEMHERNLESMERQLEYIEESVNRAYLEQQIINERHEIQRLHNMLSNLN